MTYVKFVKKSEKNTYRTHPFWSSGSVEFGHGEQGPVKFPPAMPFIVYDQHSTCDCVSAHEPTGCTVHDESIGLIVVAMVSSCGIG